MNRNPIMPFVLIMVFGIGLMFFLSFKGLGDHEEIAKDAEGGKEKTEDVASATPEDTYKASCIGCHGDAYQGGMGPALKGIGDRKTKDEIKEILTNGTSGGMPGGLVAGNEEAMAEWLTTLK